MNVPRTYTHTWTQTRLEAVQDQFRHLLQYANIGDATIDKVVDAVGKKVVGSVGIYACDKTDHRVIEVELRVNWGTHAELTLQVPEIRSGLPGWLGHQSPEVRVAGHRFADVVREQGFAVYWWIGLASQVRQDPVLHQEWNQYLGISGNARPWKEHGGTQPRADERSETLLDLPEAEIVMRHWWA